jgi:hypothetical protein
VTCPARPTVEALEDRSLPSTTFVTFGNPIPYLAGPDPFSPMVADFNGDGKADIAVLNGNGPRSSPDRHFTSFRVSVLLNNGNGSFSAPVSYDLPSLAERMVAGDFQGNGRPDLVVSAANSTLQLLVNQGDGTFAPPVPLNQTADALAVADFNGDGKQDLILMHSTSNTVSVLDSNGDGTFARPIDYPVPDPVAMAVADFNNDGHPDFAVATGGTSPSLVVFLNNGEGTFVPTLSVSTLGMNPTSLTAGDFNGDGRADLFMQGTRTVSNAPVPGSSLLLGNGDGTFAPHAANGYQLWGDYTAVGDFNADGKSDLAFGHGYLPPYGNAMTGGVSVAPSNGDGTFSGVSAYPGVGALTLGIGSFDVAVGDFNGDGVADLLVCAKSSSGTSIPPWRLPETPNDSVSLLLSTSKAPAKGMPGIGTFDPSTATWYLRNEVGPGDPDLPPFQYGWVGWKPVVGDWNGDGVSTIGAVDATGLSNPQAAVWYLRNENSGGAPDIAPFAYGLPGWIPVTGDWCGLGHAGIGMFDPSTATWYLRNEDGPGYPDAGVFRYGGAGWIPVVGDWTRNGTTTIGVIDPSTMTWYLRNKNSGGAPDITPFAYGAPGWLPVVGKFTDSGYTTVGVVDPNGAWYVRFGIYGGAPSISPFPYGLPGWTPVAGAWGWPGRPLPTVSHLSKTGPGEEALAAAITPGADHAAALDAVFAQAVV